MLETLSIEHAGAASADATKANAPLATPARWHNFAQVVALRAAGTPDKVAFTFLKDGEQAVASLTYAQLDARARAIAAGLRGVAAPGERALLMFPDGLDFVLGFLGCLYAGVIAVPVYPPHARAEYWRRLEALAADCEARHVLCMSDYAPELARHSAGLATLGRCVTSRIDDLPSPGAATAVAGTDAGTDAGTGADADADPDTAFLQYTSGSTSMPKGVVVTHRCLLDNMAMMEASFGHHADSVLVTWLPMFHDMGLIGNVLQTIYVGASCYVMAPAAFIQNPMRWLRAISTYRGTSAFAPNFAYELCAQRGTDAELAALDLRCWGMALNGAEPVRYETLRRFADKYAPCGFDERSLYPAYGLAEGTLFVSGGGRGAGVTCFDADAELLDRAALVRAPQAGAAARRLVSSGKAWHGTALRIVDALDGTVCADGVIGEIWVSNDSVANGYWGRAEESRRTFDATPAGHGGRYLRTGDLGFLHDGQLYVTGRVKELIILRGVNYYPHDIERAVQDAVPAFKAGAGAAFAVDVDGEEQLVLVQEVDRTHLRTLDLEAVFAAARQAVLRALGAAPHAIVLIRPATLPKTSSGKIQRQLARGRFIDGDLAASAVAERRWQQAPPAADAGADGVDAGRDGAAWTALLRALAARQLRLHVDQVDAAASPIALGLDSLAIAGIQHAVRERGGVALPLSALLGDASLAGLGEQLAAAAAAAAVADDGAVPDAGPAVAAPDQRADGADGIHGEAHAASAVWPMSEHQRQLWLLQAQAPDNAAYHVPLCLQGIFDPAPLGVALGALLARHPVLRSAYGEHDGVPSQWLAAEAERAPLRTIEIDGDAAALSARLLDECRRPFALERGEVCRVTHYRAPSGPEHLLFVFHHIAVDLRSVQCLMAEFGDLYVAAAAAVPGAAATPAPVPDAGYRRFVAAQLAHAAGAPGAAARAFWRARLDTALPVLQLPADRNRPALRSFAGGSEDFSIDAQLGRRLRLLAKRYGVTAGTLLLSAWQLLLGRLCGQSEVVTGVPMAGRHLPGFDDTIGYFVEPAVIHSSWRPDLPFADLARAVQASLAAALDHQGGVLGALQQAAARQGDRSVPPVFQTLYTFYPASDSGLLPFHGGAGSRPARAGALACALRPLPSPGAQLDISLLVADGGAAFGARIEYNSDLCDAATARRFGARFQVLLAALADQPHATVGALGVLTADERALVLQRWNHTDVDYGEARAIHELIGARAAADPDAVAARCEGESLTYGDLARRADALAARLAARGIGPEHRVGICAHRSLELLVALLGILKAGAAYVPVDPDYPAERIAHIVGAAAMDLVLVARALAPLVEPLLAPLGVAALVLDALVPDAPVPAALVSEALVPDHLAPDAAAGWTAPRVDDDALAYVIFTSGSTGRPKGVMNTHGAIRNRLLWMQELGQLRPGEHVLQKTPFSFDVSVWEFFWPLMAGACVVFARPGGHLEVDYLNQVLRDESIGTLHFVPSMLQAFLEQDGVALPALRQVYCSGEELPADLVRRFLARFPDVALHNLYGPTEAAVDVSHWRCEAADAERRIPIGRPIANTRLYVLDPALRPVGIGITGELYIGGAGLARGYLGRADLTAERFLPDPFAAAPGARLYRTGDLARWRADGAIEYLGRTDHQVKLRGLRIELGEVEAALTRLAGVREAVVVARGAGAHMALFAYVAGDGIDAATLRAGLEGTLPAYMVPAALAVLEALPLTANGKLDRTALPAIELARDDAPARTPRTPRERALAAAWCEVLGLAAVGLDENFFELGGHSLLAARLVSRLREAGLALRVRDVFESPTLAAQAVRAGGLADAGAAPAPVARGADAALSFAQQRLWFLGQLEGAGAADATYNMPHAVRLRGALDLAALDQAARAMVARHEVLRTVYLVRDGEPRQVVRATDGAGAVFAPLSEDWSDVPRERLEAALAERARNDGLRGFDLRHEAPLRLTLIKLAPDEHALLLCVHHIAGDGWSVELLWRELEQGYTAALAGTAPPAAPALQYLDYAAWQRDWLAGARAATQLAYWRGQLDGLPPLLELPTDHARPAARRHAGASVAVAVPASLLAPLRALGREERASLFMTLLAVFQVVLARYSGQDDIAIGSPVANRPRAEFDDLIGFFANTLVLRGRVARGASFRALLAAARETTLAAHEHQDLPFEQLVEALRPARSLSYSPLFQVMFNLQHGAAETIALPQVAAQVLPGADGVAKFDLTLTLQERGGTLAGTLEYDVDLFEQAGVARLWRHYVAVLEHVLRAPDLALDELELLGEDERAELAAWNRTEADYPREACLHTLFEAQARRAPAAIALVCGEQELSYAVLNARADRLARRLRALGVGAESAVGVCMERTPELLVALLAVLKAGGAYVPLDPNYPDGRLEHILDNARPAVVLSDAGGAERLAPLAPAATTIHAVTAAGRDGADTVADALAETPAETLPGQLAYVIYTSGSTGKPKGVAITHANAVAMLGWAGRAFDPAALRYVLASTSICFDLSVFELFLPLATGHTVVLVRDALELVERAPARPPTLINTVPSAMEALLAAGALPTSVRIVNLAGEALGRALVDKLHARAHVEQVYNLYGPSEDTTYSTGGPVERGGAQPPSIGTPLENTRAYVLDAGMRRVAPGAVGELYLAGGGISRGYLGQPGLTAERYVPDPFAALAGGRLYRTGDLVRHLPDGRLAYLGRADHQVKLRGFRIELGEIESVLAAHDGVRAAVAVVRPLGDGPPSLVAFLQLDPAAAATTEGLRRALAGVLPEYMIPTRIVALDALPLTQNGKIDRKALCLLPLDAGETSDYDPPVSETEQRLAGLWREVLGLKRVGRHDDFFDAGGHSLLATALSARVLTAFEVATGVRDIFLYPRLADQAERIDNLRWAAAGAAFTGRERTTADDLDVGVL